MATSASSKNDAPVYGPFANAVNAIGMNQFADIYAGDYQNDDGSVTIYVGPGSDTSLMSAIADLPPSSLTGGTIPPYSVVQVANSIAVLNDASQSLLDAQSSLTSEGYNLSGWGPNPVAGTLDVQLSSTPPQFSSEPPASALADAQSYLQTNVSPYIRLTSMNTSAMTTFQGRYADSSPWVGGDAIWQQGVANSQCTTGFTVQGINDHVLYALTAGHCGNAVMTNGSPTGSVLGYTSLGGQYFTGNNDVMTLQAQEGETFLGAVWLGAAGETSTTYPVGGPFTGYPAGGTGYTFDGSKTKEVRDVNVVQGGPDYCKPTVVGHTICNLIQFKDVSQSGVTPVAQTGDSGGPIFCEACYGGVVTPLALIEGGDANNTYGVFIGHDLTVTNTVIP